ncbi:C-_U-editing enzyme APOBEC-1-like isoform X2 [Dermochelys coriacea]|uniref:C->U-editing enzyme APOBEC-1-like isoform X2 n=1 Tax=Dermochelys coriacea TaxID=27794 RepID=UPI001CA936DA|nr:C->U-editing enzyme APOBEC-1-like isoform X2 [Dermochelys coriacea]
MAAGWNGDHVSKGIRQGGKISQEAFMENYDPSVLPNETYLLYEIKRNSSKRSWQNCCHNTLSEHAEIYFLEDVFKKQRSDPSDHCSITWYMSWSPCGDCGRAIRGFLKEQPNVNLVIYVARIYLHKEEINRQGLRSLMNIGVSIRVMDLPAYNYCWRTFVNHQNGEDYLPWHLIPWIMFFSFELQLILQGSAVSLQIWPASSNQIPSFSLIRPEYCHLMPLQRVGTENSHVKSSHYWPESTANHQQLLVFGPGPAVSHHQPLVFGPGPVANHLQQPIFRPGPAVSHHQPLVFGPGPVANHLQQPMFRPGPAVSHHQPLVFGPGLSTSCHLQPVFRPELPANQ